MQVNFTKPISAAKKREITEACNFYAGLLMDPRTVRNLNIDIELVKKHDMMGECISDDDERYPRFFTIILRDGPGDDDYLKTLAHEMVHVKQYAKRELVSGIMVAAKGGFKITCKWMGDVWKPKSKEDDYYDSPWEIEAYGREVGLYKRWVQHAGVTK